MSDELLHRLANPPRGVGPEWGLEARVKTLSGPQEPNDALLQQLRAVHERRVAIGSGDARDQGHEALNELVARGLVTARGGADQSALTRRREPVPVLDAGLCPEPVVSRCFHDSAR